MVHWKSLFLSALLLSFSSTSFAQDSFESNNFYSKDQAPSLLSSEDELALIDAIVAEFESADLSKQSSLGDLISIDWRQHCIDAGTIFCRIYCRNQTEHSYSNCMNGFLWIDGCLDKVKDLCKQLAPKQTRRN